MDVDHRDVEGQTRLLREQMAGFGWETDRIAHLDDAPDFYLDEVAPVSGHARYEDKVVTSLDYEKVVG